MVIPTLNLRVSIRDRGWGGKCSAVELGLALVTEGCSRLYSGQMSTIPPVYAHEYAGDGAIIAFNLCSPHKDVCWPVAVAGARVRLVAGPANALWETLGDQAYNTVLWRFWVIMNV